eukprot:5957501-Pyramimonas_sp.AAC.1
MLLDHPLGRGGAHGARSPRCKKSRKTMPARTRTTSGEDKSRTSEIPQLWRMSRAPRTPQSVLNRSEKAPERSGRELPSS